MKNNISKRRSFLMSQKNSSHRITIGFAGIADFRSFIGQEYIAGMLKAAADYDLNFINFAGAIKYSIYDDIDFISYYLKNFKLMKAPLLDGLVTWASSLCGFMSNDEVVSLFSNLNPLPMVDIGYLDIPNVPSIRIDNNFSISLIMNHLIEAHDCKKFAFIGSKVAQPHLKRLEAYKAELRKHNIPEIKDSVFLSETMNAADIASMVDALVARHNINNKDIECIVTPSDLIASQVIENLDKHGISVPGDIAVTGFNNQYAGISARSPITTTNLEYFKRGYTSVEFLIDRIMEPEKKFENNVVETSLIIRQSCGCFEKSILNAGSLKLVKTNLLSDTNISEENLRANIHDKAKEIFSRNSEPEITKLVDAIFIDMYEKPEPSSILRWFQGLLQSLKNDSSIDMSHLQQQISDLRSVVLPIVKDDENQYLHIENIFHEMRALISVYIEYNTLSTRENSYFMNTISQIALNFASATSKKQIKDILKVQLGELEIPGITLALSENMTSDIAPVNVELIYPEPADIIKEKLPISIKDPAFFPKSIFSQKQRYSLMFELLHYGDNFFGYAFMDIGTPNISIYDTVRMLLSNALNSVYIREGRTKEKSALLNDEQITEILQSTPYELDTYVKSGLRASTITDYLLEHINEMTNLDQMSIDLCVSKSHLVRRAKELTGYTIQSLHEKLKIEQAKNLLKIDSMKLGEISERLGFQNQNYFSSVFKKNTGLSPREWIRRNH